MDAVTLIEKMQEIIDKNNRSFDVEYEFVNIHDIKLCEDVYDEPIILLI